MYVVARTYPLCDMGFVCADAALVKTSPTHNLRKQMAGCAISQDFRSCFGAPLTNQALKNR